MHDILRMDWDRFEDFIRRVFYTETPGLIPQYPFSRVRVWQQLDREYPGAVALHKRNFDWDGDYGYAFWHSDPAAKNLYEWFDDAREGKVMDPRTREKELAEQMIPDYWKVSDINWLVSILNPAFQTRMAELRINSEIVSADDWLDYIRGKGTLSLTLDAKSNSPTYIFSNGEFFLMVQGQEAYVLSESQIAESLPYFTRGDFAVSVFVPPILNWLLNSPSQLL